MNDTGALAVLAVLGLVGAVAIILAIVNRRARSWRFGVFYERRDDDEK